MLLRSERLRMRASDCLKFCPEQIEHSSIEHVAGKFVLEPAKVILLVGNAAGEIEIWISTRSRAMETGRYGWTDLDLFWVHIFSNSKITEMLI